MSARRLLPGVAAGVLAVSLAGADVLVLKDGRKVSGDVREKKETLAIRVEGQELVFGKDEVKARYKTPAEMLKGRTADVEAAKALYQEGLKLQDLRQQSAKMKLALEKANRAREAYAEVRDLFPENKYAELDDQLVKISLLMRLIRDRVGSGVISAAATPKPGPKSQPDLAKPVAPTPPVAVLPNPVPPPKPSALSRAFGILADPAKRGDATSRASAEKAFAGARGTRPHGDLAAAAHLFLRGEADLSADVTGAADGWLAEQKIAEAADFDAAAHRAAAEALAKPIASVKGKGEAPLVRFAAGHLASALACKPPLPAGDAAACAKALGFAKSETAEVWGPPSGLAARDHHAWMESSMYDLGVAQLRKEHRRTRDFGVQYLLAHLHLRDVFAKRMNYRRALATWLALAKLPGTREQRAHAAAVANALRKRLPCTACNGTHAIRCPVCRGKKQVDILCPRCEGSGKLMTLRGTFACRTCARKGVIRGVKCTKCKQTGEVVCKGLFCSAPVAPPTFEEIYEAPPCATCRGTGLATLRVPTRCPDCLGIGVILIPKTEPDKTLNAK